MKLSIFYAKKKPAVAVGEHQCNLLNFLFKYRGLHSLGQDSKTQKAARGLVKRGLVNINEFNQIEFVG